MREFLDYFWGSSKLFLDTHIILVANEEILAPIIATNEKNFDRFVALSEYRDILHSINIRADIFSIQSAQIGIINALTSSKISAPNLIKAVEILKDENIIDNENFKFLKDFLEKIYTDSYKNDTDKGVKTDFFHAKTDTLNSIFENMLSICSDEICKKLKSAKNKIDELSFNIVVTGVINAGKSTMLNALLQKEILGTSNVPETANLTILKYSKNEFANVNFWDKDELSALNITPTKEHEKFIGKNITTQIEKLQNYTSAKYEISKMVKSVTLNKDIKILSDNICIVDTPGIDDAVFLREQLVKNYMHNCDLMVHLMNASQSATQKDIEFIINSIKNSHIVRLCIVLTHADMLNKNELIEVANYTKNSITKEFKNNGLDEFLTKLDIFCISAKEFFKGSKDSGLKEFTDYLYEIFFGPSNQKATLSISSYKKELTNICLSELNNIEQTLLNLNSSQINLNEQIIKISSEQDMFESTIKKVNELAIKELENIDINALNSSFKTDLKSLNTNIKDRILNEVNYARRINKIDKNRINYIIQNMLNDGILQIARQKRNEILSLIISCANKLRLNFNNLDIQIKDEIFNIGEYLNSKNIKFDYEKIFNTINPFLNQEKKLDIKLNLALDEFLEDKNLSDFVKSLVEFEKNRFRQSLKNKLDEMTNKLQADKNRVLNELLLLKDSKDELKKNLKILNSKKDKFKSFLKELQDV